jgi:hypothetical protein
LVQVPVRTIIRIEKYRNRRNFWHKIAQEFEPLAPHRGRGEDGDPGEIASRPIEARDKAFLDWIVAPNKNDRSARCCRFGGKGSGRATRGDDHYSALD